MRPPKRPLGRSSGAERAVTASALGALLVLGAWIAAVPASAAPTCTFDAMTATVTVEVGNGESATIARSGDAITLDGQPCDAATVTTADAIVVNGTGIPGTISIDLGGGDFAPGATPESDGGDAEVEFTINVPAGSPTLLVTGGGGADVIVLGTGGINLNANESAGDVDVLINGDPTIAIEGGAGADQLSVAGGAGTGAASAASLSGGGENDLLFGGLGGSSFAGGDGDDRIGGGEGDDSLDGGPGIDTVTFGAVDAGVQVDLRDGTSSGEGDDSLTGFENVMGSKHADTIRGDEGPNKLAGGAGADELFALGAADELRGGPGNDELHGQKGDDRLFGLSGRDQLDGGEAQDVCKGGPDPDSFVFCENIQLG